MRQLVFYCSLWMSIISAYPYEPYRFNFTRSRYSSRWSTTTEPAATTHDVGEWKSTTELDDSVDILTESFVNESETGVIVNTDKSERSEAHILSTTEATSIESIEPERHNCGIRTNEDFPWIVVLEHTDPYALNKKSRKTLSKGVLITPQHVLTTVSSVFNSNPFWVVSKVRLGDTATWGDISISHNKSSIISIDVEQIFQHERKDIAVIKLVQPVNITAAIVPICLPDHDNYNFRELQLHMCKRQSSHSASIGPYVFSVPVTPLTPQDCSIMFERKNAHYTLDEFCAWDEAGDTCTGDLGGPLITETHGRAAVIGLNSYISAKEDFNADDYPGIYTRVGVHLKWIHAVLKL